MGAWRQRRRPKEPGGGAPSCSAGRWLTQVLAGVKTEQVLLFFLLALLPTQPPDPMPQQLVMDRMGINVCIQLVIAASSIFVAL
jgi:hypothetical protein